MVFKEVSFYNFRIYKGTNIIYLSPEGDQNISVISGLNGYGKTTFLMGLVWCLYGRQMDQVDEFYKKEIRGYEGYDKYIGNSLNRLADKEGDTKFSVSIIISDINIPEIPCQEIKITRTYDNVTGNSDQVEILIDGCESELVRDLGDEKLTSEEIFIRDFILPIEIAKFFFFDAEKIISLAEVTTKNQRRNLNMAYSEVLGIKKYEDLKAELEELRLKLKQESASTMEKIELETLTQKKNTFEIQIQECEDVILDKLEEKDELQNDSNQIQEKLIRQGNQISVQQLEELRAKASDFKSKIKDLHDQLKKSYEIIPFAIAGDRLIDVVRQLDVESESKNAQLNQDKINSTTDQIINDLIAQPKPENIVIDHRVEEYYKSTINKLIRKHFFSDIPEVGEDFSLIHEYSETEKNELNVLVNNLKHSFKESFKRINGEYNRSRNELSGIKRALKAAESNAEDLVISALREKKNNCDSQIKQIDNEISDLNQKIGAYKSDITQLKKKIESISDKIKVSDKNRDKEETTKRLITELQDFIKQFKKEKKKSLEKEILSGLNSLMHKQNFIKSVDVDIISDEIDIQLKNNRKEVIRKESLSNGEKQMYASALLKGLVEESNIEFPVFIDSPMQKFDIEHAENIVRYFYPNISDQVVIFPLIKKEMTEEEYEIILPKVANTYLIENVSDDQSSFKEVEPKALFAEFEMTRKDAV